ISKVAVVPLEGSAPQQVFALPINFGGIAWSPDSKAIQFVQARAGIRNLWEQPLSGGSPRQLTNFSESGILGFAWSRDGSQLALPLPQPEPPTRRHLLQLPLDFCSDRFRSALGASDLT